MAKANRQRPARVNFFDGQRVTEADLDAEQIHHRSLVSDLTKDFHASGVLRDRLFESRILFDSSNPGKYSEDENEETKFLIESGRFDGKPLRVDSQPSDRDYGNRLEIEAKNLLVGGFVSAKVLILGTTYSSLNKGGDLTVECIEFSENDVKITENYFLSVVAILFNNLSGGEGRTENDLLVESKNTMGDKGCIIIRESEPLKVFSKSDCTKQVESPNIYLKNFITSSSSRTIEDELKSALGAAYNFSDVYFELQSKEKIYFQKDGNQTVSYGQKFLSKTNNIQGIDLLLSIEEDSSAGIDERFDFSGDIVLSVHKLSKDIKCITDPQPTNLIDFDPEQSPLIEVSYSQGDLKSAGIILTDKPKPVRFDLSGTLLADPNIEPSLNRDEFYAFLVSRRGDNRTGTVVMEKGFSKASRKRDNGQRLSAEEEFGKEETRYIEFDPNNSTFIDDKDSSLWFIIHSSAIEVTDGVAYSEDGYPMVLPKTDEFVGSTEVLRYERSIDLNSVAEGNRNYVVINRMDKFESPNIHPRTGNFVNTRISDSPSISVISAEDLSKYTDENVPIILARVIDRNVKEAQDIYGSFEYPGLISADEILVIDPDPDFLQENLIGRVFSPDIDCDCNSRYRIIDVTCEVHYAGDLDGDGRLTNSDLPRLLSVVGNTINTETTERKILGGEISYVDFLKSDLNGDGTVDGDDIDLLENAIGGMKSFSIPEKMNILRIRVENLLQKDDFPEIYSSEDDPSTSLAGSTLSGSDSISFNVQKEEQAFIIRAGDTVEVSEGGLDDGSYVIYSKVVDASGLGVTLLVKSFDNSEVSFSGAGGLRIVVRSGKETNMLANNHGLSKVPFANISWLIAHEGAAFDSSFIEICDLRRYVETNFVEEIVEKCKCSDESCISGEKCSPVFKNQKVLANDLFIPNGEIYSKPGVPYHGDIEYSTVSIPIPPGTIDDCSIDLYKNFVKADNGSCVTASGYPAMTYSDGTYVGCEDSGGSTDITKGRIKFSQCIASLHVDAFVDGYATDGYADETDTYTASEVIGESFIDHTFPNTLGFTDWPMLASGNASVTMDPNPNEPAIFDLTTINADYRYAAIEHPSGAVADLSGDFIIDFIVSMNSWKESDLLFGKIFFSTSVTITNDDGTHCDLKLGWRQLPHQSIKIFYSGSIYDTASGNLLSDFDFEEEYSAGLNEEIRFRLRRVDEAVFAMYYDKTNVDQNSLFDGQLVRIGGLVPVQPGLGDAKVSFELSQEDNPNTGIDYRCTLHDVILNYNYLSQDLSESESLLVERTAASNFSRVTAAFPFLLTRRTNIISASLELTASSAISSAQLFNIIPYDIVNASNFGTLINYPLETNHSFVSTFSTGNLNAGESVSVDITSIVIYFLSQGAHLPGFQKAIAIEPSQNAVESFSFDRDMLMVIEYEDITTGVVFKVGASIDAATGIVSLNTKNVLYDSVNESNRTVLNFGVYLKKSGFKNEDISVNLSDLSRIGIGACTDISDFDEDELCFFVAGSTATGTFVEGPFPCYFHLP